MKPRILKGIDEITIMAPATLFLTAIEKKVLRSIPLEESYKLYKDEGLLESDSTFSDFMRACGMVLLSRICQDDFRLTDFQLQTVDMMFIRMKTNANNQYKRMRGIDG